MIFDNIFIVIKREKVTETLHFYLILKLLIVTCITWASIRIIFYTIPVYYLFITLTLHIGDYNNSNSRIRVPVSHSISESALNFNKSIMIVWKYINLWLKNVLFENHLAHW